MSDFWYRDPAVIEPYEDWEGNLWTLGGECLNPVHICEPPRWHLELAMAELRAEIAMSIQQIS